MEKNKKASSGQKVVSRNRNKNKNKTLQNKVKEREIAKKEKARRLAEEVENAVEEVVIDDVVIRDDIVVVPDRKDITLEKVKVDDDSLDDGFETIMIQTADNTEIAATNDNDDFIEVKVNKFRFVEDENEETGVSDKFKFVTTADEKNETDEIVEDADLDEFHEVMTDKVHETVYDEDTIVKVETIDTKNEEIIPRPTEDIDINAKKHISFEKRVIGLLVIVVISFFVAGLLIFKAVTHIEKNAITFDEKASVDYNICINEETYGQYYSSSCLDENMEYLTGISERMPVSFKYNVGYSESVDKTLDYYVVSKMVISKEINGKILNTVEDVLVDRTSYSVFGDEGEFLVDVDVPIKKYVDYVKAYDSQFGLTSYASLEITFYIDNGNSIRKAAVLSMPISTTTFSVEKAVVDNENQNLSIAEDDWGSINTSYAVVGLIFVLIGLLGIIKLADLVYKVMGTTNLYQRKLNKILREYDRHIVIARGEYNIDTSKKLIKVASFGELLDARDTLEKPIVYLKVNSVKSEFYVEDSEAIYKYTMKEADFEGK